MEHCLEGWWNLWKQSPLSAMPLHTNQCCQLLNTEVYTKIKEYKWRYNFIRFDDKRVSIGLFKIYCAISSHLERLHGIWQRVMSSWACTLYLGLITFIWVKFDVVIEALVIPPLLHPASIVVYQLPTSETYENQSGLGLLCGVWLRIYIYNSWKVSSQYACYWYQAQSMSQYWH